MSTPLPLRNDTDTDTDAESYGDDSDSSRDEEESVVESIRSLQPYQFEPSMPERHESDGDNDDDGDDDSDGGRLGNTDW